VQDIADAQRLIQQLSLPENLAEQLNPYVRDKYRELWSLVHNNPFDPD
jgi:hypothetical protein